MKQWVTVHNINNATPASSDIILSAFMTLFQGVIHFKRYGVVYIAKCRCPDLASKLKHCRLHTMEGRRAGCHIRLKTASAESCEIGLSTLLMDHV